MAKSLSYKDAGVDIEAGNDFVTRIGHHVKKTHGTNVLNIHNGFAGAIQLFDKKNSLFAKKMKDPVLLTCTDGVGTKLKLAFQMDKHDTVGIDLVAMSVNDLIVHGGQPLTFLDYIATGKLDPAKMADVVKGISDGCVQAGCALIGGETAEMPDFYAPNEYDLAGFAVGLVERSKMLLGKDVEPGDVVIGLASSGLHSNGFSLARKAIASNQKQLRINSQELGCKIGEALLEPTRIYVKPVLELLSSYKTKKVVHAMSHITGGGLVENVPRVLPAKAKVVIKKASWPIPPIFKMIQKGGNVKSEEMFRAFNMGIGYVFVVSKHFVDPIMKKLKKSGETPYIIGDVRKGSGDIIFK